MKLVVSDIIRYRLPVLFLLLLLGNTAQAQYKYEREHRIRKSQFPANALRFIEKKLEDARQVRFYREVDSIKISYEAKFKLDRLRYSVEFDQQGRLEDVEILIREIDIPEESLQAIKEYLSTNFQKYRIRRIQQQYPVSDAEPTAITLRNAFQNLLLPTNRYELIVAGRKDKGFNDYEILFNAEGEFLSIRKSLPANYDHVLY